MEEEAQEERDSMAREKEKCSTELRAAARQNRKMATALLQVLIAERLMYFHCCLVIFWFGSGSRTLAHYHHSSKIKSRKEVTKQ
jgi:hypothetical protein